MKSIVESGFSQRIHTISPEVCSFDAALKTAEAWRANGNYFIFKAGSFDLLTLNHVLALTQFRALGAMSILGLDAIKSKAEQAAVHSLAASNKIKLMLTVGTNAGVSREKSYKVEKGEVTKPVLDWRSRAMMLAAQSIPIPGQGKRQDAVDYITRHGPECCDSCQSGNCINENNDTMAVKLRPDLVVITEWQRTAGHLENYKNQGLLPNTSIAVVKEEDNQYSDPLLSSSIKTTSIINKLRA